MGTASNRRACKQAQRLNSIKDSCPLLFQYYLGQQLEGFRRRARYYARNLGDTDAPPIRVWQLMRVQTRFIYALNLSPAERESLLEESREICRSAFAPVLPYCGRPLNWSVRLAMRP